jgi:hypothetical protein
LSTVDLVTYGGLKAGIDDDIRAEAVRLRLHLPPADFIVGDCQLSSGQFARALNRRKRIELVTTKMLESDIANPAISGLRWPVAANGIAATL